MTEYEIQPPSLRCARTGRELRPGELCYSVLTETPEGFVRQDYSAEAWEGAPEGAIGFWRSRVPHPDRPGRPRPVEDAAVLEYFEQLAGEQDAGPRGFRYILALLLIRRKVLKFVGVEHSGDDEILVLRAPATGDEYRVTNPRLCDEELAAVQAEVGKILTQSA
jgi:hypothetical protein